jgi:hypothetical protein
MRNTTERHLAHLGITALKGMAHMDIASVKTYNILYSIYNTWKEWTRKIRKVVATHT